MTRILVALLTVAMLAPLCRAELTPEQRRLVLDEALTAYDRGIESVRRDPAGARDAFAEAAERFEVLLDDGVLNGRLLYNLGNAHLQAGNVGRAIANYRRAERFIPGDERLERNLTYARSLPRMQIAPAGTRALTDALLSWHGSTSLSTRGTAFAVAYVVFWIALAGWLLRRGSGWLYLVATAAAIAIACGASVGADVLAGDEAGAGVVIAEEVTVRKGNGDGYAPQLEQPLTEGVEFTVLEERAGWLMIELPDGKTGWIPAAAAVLV